MSTNNSNITTFDTASVKCKQIIKNNENNSGTHSENIQKQVDMIKHRHSGEEIFRAAAASHQDAAKRQLSSASDEFLLSAEEEDFDQKKDAVMSILLQKLNNKASLNTVVADDLGRTVKYIEEALKSKSNVCLICIESVLQTDPVWNCSGCFTMFHIQCMQQWVREGVQHKSALSSEHFPNKDRPWFCPKCRHEYQQKDFPKLYVCFCGKETDPAFDAWLVPHSCGHSCGRTLKPDCGHRCLLQCHPGPFPPCAKTVPSRCFCGRSSEQVRRCGVARWSCGTRCGRTMNCGHHSCPRPCHKVDSFFSNMIPGTNSNHGCFDLEECRYRSTFTCFSTIIRRECCRMCKSYDDSNDNFGNNFGGNFFGGSDFGGSDFGGSDFGGSDFGGSDFGGSDFGGSDFGGNNFDRNDNNLDFDFDFDFGENNRGKGGGRFGKHNRRPKFGKPKFGKPKFGMPKFGRFG